MAERPHQEPRAQEPQPDDWPPPEPPDDDWPPPVGEIGQNLALLNRWRVTPEARLWIAELLGADKTNTRNPRELMFAYVEWLRIRHAREVALRASG